MREIPFSQGGQAATARRARYAFLFASAFAFGLLIYSLSIDSVKKETTTFPGLKDSKRFAESLLYQVYGREMPGVTKSGKNVDGVNRFSQLEMERADPVFGSQPKLDRQRPQTAVASAPVRHSNHRGETPSVVTALVAAARKDPLAELKEQPTRFKDFTATEPLFSALRPAQPPAAARIHGPPAQPSHTRPAPSMLVSSPHDDAFYCGCAGPRSQSAQSSPRAAPLPPLRRSPSQAVLRRRRRGAPVGRGIDLAFPLAGCGAAVARRIRAFCTRRHQLSVTPQLERAPPLGSRASAFIRTRRRTPFVTLTVLTRCHHAFIADRDLPKDTKDRKARGLNIFLAYTHAYTNIDR